jgi:hypothetical protein
MSRLELARFAFAFTFTFTFTFTFAFTNQITNLTFCLAQILQS